MASNVMQYLTDRVITMLKEGKVPWRRPWKGSMAPCNISGRKYNGINFFLLSMLGFETPVFLTFNQIKKMGGTIKDGEEKKHVPVYFWKINTYTEDRFGNVLNDPRKIPLCLYTRVYNISQVDGIELPARFQTKREALPVLDAAQAIVDGYKDCPQVTHGGNRACYSPVLDKISMPIKENFINAESYYATLFHEMAHSTGHAKRLNRKEVMDPIVFGSHDYSQEELVAEMGAALACAHAGIDNTLDNSVAYIASWLDKLSNDPKVLMMAASRAQKAFDHIAPQFTTDATEQEETA
jgi:antirestriction protein ArdC